MNVNEHLAIVVMGWKYVKINNERTVYVDPDKVDMSYPLDIQYYEFTTDEWKPAENFGQALLCAKKVNISSHDMAKELSEGIAKKYGWEQ